MSARSSRGNIRYNRSGRRKDSYLGEGEGELVRSMGGAEDFDYMGCRGGMGNCCRERVEAIQKSFRFLRLALLIDWSCGHEIRVKGLDSTYLAEGLRVWGREENRVTGDLDDDPLS